MTRESRSSDRREYIALLMTATVTDLF